MLQFPSEEERERRFVGIQWIGLLSSDPAPVTGGTLLDTLCAQLQRLASFAPGERDLVMLQHKFVVEWQDGKKVRNPAPANHASGANPTHRKHPPLRWSFSETPRVIQPWPCLSV